ncbi:MAG TPA: condensation domain-containing protein, partial [Thermoanaerobaculia bacterium]|nr:condensation domain-containing protein [Thermoanaerobaculia bacterium]
YVLDRNLSLMPVGVPGELYLGGLGVSRGYLGRPDLTAERYVPDLFARGPGERLYKTGDLARYLSNGELEYLGRLDHQVKVRGFRVELGEIEAALLAHPDIQDAAVLALGEGGDRRLVAYVVGDPLELRGYLKEKLPEYMVPSAFVALDALPLTPNGKTDRRALAKVEPERTVEGSIAPRTAAESRLAEIWCEVLGLEAVGVQDDFFDLGGHSLLATQLVSRVRESFGVELPLRRLFEVSTVESLAAELAGTTAAVAPPLRRVDRSGDLPLSFAQERMWVLNRLEPESPLYNIPGGLRLRGRLDVEALRAALREIVRRHEALRTTFAVKGGRPVQVVAAALDLPVPVEELDEADLHRRSVQEARQPFDLAAGPLVRARLLRLGEEEHVLLVTFHHIVADGWSIGVFVRELSALYAALAAGQPSPLPELEVQYADFAVWQRGWLSGDALASRIAWWRESLAGAPAQLEIPADRPRPPQPSYRGATRRKTLPALPLESRGATPFMALLAALGALFHRYTGQEDILLGSPVAGRDQVETEGLIGFFVNTLVLRVGLAGDPGFGELLDRVREMALGVYTHQDVPFEKLVEELSPQRDPSRTPLFQVVLALQNAPASLPELPGLAAELLETDPGVARFDLTLFVRETPEGFEAALEHALDLFESATADRMLGHFGTLLAGALAEPGRPLSSLPLLTAAESRQLLEDWTRPGPEWPDDVLLHEFFEAQARRTPGAIALIGGAERLTYRELDERADRMARRLRAMGVGPEVRVGVFLQRTPRLLVAMLGILKAGGAYVPLDPAYPKERIEAILEDAQAPVVITEEMMRAEEDTPADLPALEPLPVRMGRLAYVIYTSGSTGRPKGVAIEHRSVSALMHWSRENFSDAELKGVLASTSICFDMSVFELFAPLAWGGKVVLADNALALPSLPAAGEVTL